MVKQTGKFWLVHLLGLAAPSLTLGSKCPLEALSLIVVFPPMPLSILPFAGFSYNTYHGLNLPACTSAGPSAPLECMLQESRGLDCLMHCIALVK